MTRRRLVKLVRDRVGRFLGSTVMVSYERVPESQVVDLLDAKLIEEAVEYLKEPSIGELADIYAVLKALAYRRHGARWGEVVEEALAKAEERGEFDDGIGMYLETTAPLRHEGSHA